MSRSATGGALACGYRPWDRDGMTTPDREIERLAPAAAPARAAERRQAARGPYPGGEASGGGPATGRRRSLGPAGGEEAGGGGPPPRARQAGPGEADPRERPRRREERDLPGGEPTEAELRAWWAAEQAGPQARASTGAQGGAQGGRLLPDVLIRGGIGSGWGDGVTEQPRRSRF